MNDAPKIKAPNCFCAALRGNDKCDRCQQWEKLPRLRQAIIDNTRSEDMFWLGEILLNEMEKETGYGEDSRT